MLPHLGSALYGWEIGCGGELPLLGDVLLRAMLSLTHLFVFNKNKAPPMSRLPPAAGSDGSDGWL